MQITIRFFASAREATGRTEARLELEPGATVQDAFAALCETHPALRELPLRFALDEAFAEPGDAVREGATLALIPPVGGG